MNTALLPEPCSLAEQVRLLLATVECLRHEVAELRVENADCGSRFESFGAMLLIGKAGMPTPCSEM